MLQRFEEIQGIGLLHDANGQRHTCRKVTLIYADNGRGKSTLAAILRSVAKNEPAIITSAKTIDGANPPKAALRFESGHRVAFEGGSWTEQRREILVFDSAFVERNVHSGGVVNTNHRKNLLEFALGESAVDARSNLDLATAAATRSADNVQSIVRTLSGHHSGMILSDFEALLPSPDIDDKIATIRRRISDARNIETLRQQSVPKTVTEPPFNIDNLFSTLALSLENIHASADNTVREHISTLRRSKSEESAGGANAERWLSEGQQFVTDSTCPFCAQDVSGNDLIQAYKTHFNEAYNDLKDAIAELKATTERATGLEQS